MNGKQIKVTEYNLTFGSSARIVNILGLFKYKKNNNLYVLYSDLYNKYNIIYYGNSHIKETTILSMESKNKEDEEIIKEYIYKITNNENLDDYEEISLDKIEGIEIISSNKIEIKKEILDSLIDKKIPKKEEINNKPKTKKKKKGKGIIILLFLIIIGVGGYFIYNNIINKEEVIKQMICITKYNHDVLEATVNEELVLNFDINDVLEKKEITKEYKFNNETEYYNFINTGNYYKYMPEDTTEGGWDKDDSNYTYKTIEVERIKVDYKEPTNYEEVLSYYKNKNYNCEEKVIN
ncbi:MAG: hypothetical protein IJI49_05720 [Bacilli bacterium]|nr:hypothetical protein [Bacilli bacterium]